MASPVDSAGGDVPGPALSRGAVVGFASRRALTVTCLEGRLWITQTGRAGDVILSAGERYQCAAGGKVVVQALAAANRLLMTTER